VLSATRFAGFRSHPKLEGTHAFLSPSSYHWINYDQAKLLERLNASEAASRGSSLHELAAHAISEGVYLREDEGNLATYCLAMYVNDAIDLGMVPEQTLFYYKSGVSPTSEKQLYVYAALFCLEYGYLPYEVNGELRIYQFDGYRSFEIDRAFLAHVVDMIRMHDKNIEEFREARREKRGMSWRSR
jgi:hypothetical protein